MRELLWMIRHFWNSISPRKRIQSWQRDILGWWKFWQDYRTYLRLAHNCTRPAARYLFPCLGENTVETPIEPTYFYQDAWAFEKIVSNRPQNHIDIGSQHKFVSLLSKVVPVTMVDIRPLSLSLDSLTFHHGSILDLPFKDRSIESLSSLCVIEHIGLGRYGDPIDPHGSEKAIEELKRVIKLDGNLYLSLPIDDENRVYFNAHRAFTEKYLLSILDGFILEESRYIYGQEYGAQKKSGFGTGCYHLRRIK